MHKRVFIIAEAGVNHNGSLETAKKMIDAAAEAGADAVKFQTFHAEDIACAASPKAEYQTRREGEGQSQLEMLKKLELDEAAHKELLGYCARKGIRFLSTPFDLRSVSMLVRLGLDVFKIPSGEITNLPYLRRIGGLNKEVILSSGMADLEEIGKAVDIIVASGTGKDKITVLHCNTEYPTPLEDVNLKAMLSIKETYGVRIGYSDHTLGIEVPIAAAALGAEVIEKHFTLSRKMKGPDHEASLEPDELKKMIEAVRKIEKALGDGIKRPSFSERKNKGVVRKSIVAARAIKRGEIFTEKNLAVKRPASGISPMEWDKVLGSPAKRDFKKEETIEL